MIDIFKKEKINISQVELCPHSPDVNCHCRKPKILMIENILNNFQIDLDNSWLIGDKSSDIQCAINSNIKNTIQVKTGHKFEEKESLATFVTTSIKDIKSIIKS
jgi:D-glycero-D-manno-heptose 1,7-bisphosphate phosphatase